MAEIIPTDLGMRSEKGVYILLESHLQVWHTNRRDSNKKHKTSNASFPLYKCFLKSWVNCAVDLICSKALTLRRCVSLIAQF